MTLIKDLIPLIGIVAILIGFAAILAPAFAIKGYGLNVTGSALGYVRALGVRDIFLGTMILFHFFVWQPRALAIVFFGAALVSFVDFIVVLKERSPLAIGHATGLLVSLAYGAWLLSQWN